MLAGTVLAVCGSVIAPLLDGIERKLFFSHLDLLKTYDVRRDPRQPVQEASLPGTNRVEIPGSNLQMLLPPVVMAAALFAG